MALDAVKVRLESVILLPFVQAALVVGRAEDAVGPGLVLGPRTALLDVDQLAVGAEHLELAGGGGERVTVDDGDVAGDDGLVGVLVPVGSPLDLVDVTGGEGGVRLLLELDGNAVGLASLRVAVDGVVSRVVGATVGVDLDHGAVELAVVVVVELLGGLGPDGEAALVDNLALPGRRGRAHEGEQEDEEDWGEVQISSTDGLSGSIAEIEGQYNPGSSW